MKSLSRTAIVLSLDQILGFTAFGASQSSRSAASGPVTSTQNEKETSSLGVTFVDTAREAGL
ncbi:MAG TPA: hypothetical protein VG498_01595, partial [Terriglobales bacterium]|nr:hypothetical protein [Terriglobales bacterium]